jgi:small subunit ribosomal protein S7
MINIKKEKSFHYLLRKFMNHLMVDGKKGKAEKILIQTFCLLQTKEEKSPLEILLRAIENTKPSVEVRSVRRGGATYQIPIPLKEKRAISLGIKWLVQAARKKQPSSMVFTLASILVEASKNVGESVKKKENLHQVALKNRSLTHFRWF